MKYLIPLLLLFAACDQDINSLSCGNEWLGDKVFTDCRNKTGVLTILQSSEGFTVVRPNGEIRWQGMTLDDNCNLYYYSKRETESSAGRVVSIEEITSTSTSTMLTIKETLTYKIEGEDDIVDICEAVHVK